MNAGLLPQLRTPAPGCWLFQPWASSSCCSSSPLCRGRFMAGSLDGRGARSLHGRRLHLRLTHRRRLR
eukprot:10680505-Alexandrium_andersonii.AAC.1